MSLDTYGTADLMGVVQAKSKFQTLFLNLFYPRVYFSGSEEIKLDEVTEETNIAVTVSPVVGGKVLASQGYGTNTFKAAYVKPKHEVNVKQLMHRRAGERLTGELTKAQRRNATIANNLLKEEKSILQYEEKQAVDGILYGGYTVSGEGYETQHVSFNQRPENRVVLGPGERWADKDPDTYDPTHDIEEICQASDGVISLALMDSEAWILFSSFKKVQEKLDTRRGSTSSMETALKDVGDVVSFKGWYGDVAIMVTRHFYIEGGVKKRYMPPFTILFGHSSAQCVRAYGAIQDIHAVREGMEQTDRYPRNWIEQGDPAREYTMLQSAPLMIPLDINDFVVLVVGTK
ncbi:major capsid protein [Oceanospirillum sediminis]|uniref:Major capsid protein n=1 Tax=Oceanospirillum sediminis TaxID=2760088 RepID=A0A839IXH8_9GAMM|nr:major capsid protein [Oceanospirillum sediminis]MBB1489390.1 major capsid protein [Oceanospirillum sediminis]